MTYSINSENQDSPSWLQLSFFESHFPEFSEVIQIMRVVNSSDNSQFTIDNSPLTPLNKWDLNNSQFVQLQLDLHISDSFLRLD